MLNRILSITNMAGYLSELNREELLFRNLDVFIIVLVQQICACTF